MTQHLNENHKILVLALAQKYQYNKEHAEFIEKTSLELFDLFSSQHQLGKQERELLSHACLLHDIGTFISEKRHHRHTSYIITYAEELINYPELERKLLSLITFNHRKKIHSSTDDLSRFEKETVLILSAILRLADAFGYNGESAQIIEARLSPDNVVLFVKGIKNFPLLTQRFEKKKELYQEMFDQEISLQKHVRKATKPK